MTQTHAVLAYFAVINAAGFCLMAWDKRQAVMKGWRVAEKTLLGVALAGGAVGVYAAMRTLRHKTRHWRFFLVTPVLIPAQLAALWLIVR